MNNKKNKKNNRPKEEKIMDNSIMDLSEYKKRKTFSPRVNLSFVDMVFDKNKRNCTYEKYDKNYKSTSEEDEIFKEMTRRRKGDNK